ncbi:MAG: putative amidoligase domain-containing protein [Limnochordia bacterium]|jgi:hypothetical protein
MSNLFLYEDESVRNLMEQYLTDWIFARQPLKTESDIVVRWGNESAPEMYPLALNPVHGSQTARAGRLFRRIMKLSGITTSSQVDEGVEPPWKANPRNLRHRFQIGVFDMSVIFFREEMATGAKATSGVRSSEVRRLKELAMRAVYASGLDFGVVHAGVERKTRELVILGVDPAPRLAANTALRFAGGMLRYASAINSVKGKMRSKSLAIGLGADPEFTLAKRDGGRAFASDYLPVAGSVGCEMQPAQFNGRSHKPVAELRPNYALSPIRLFNNLKQTVDRANQLIPPGIVWLAGSVPDGTFPTGGHIHFSRIPLSTRLLRSLDSYLAAPLLLVEDPARTIIRRPRYGFLGDIRVKSHGGFEYRTPFSWLHNPVLARGTLCLAYVVAREHLLLTQNLFADPLYIEAFYAAEKGPFRQRLDALWADLEGTPSFDTYRKSLSELRALIDSGWVVDEGADFRRVWFGEKGRV